MVEREVVSNNKYSCHLVPLHICLILFLAGQQGATGQKGEQVEINDESVILFDLLSF